MKPRNKVKLRWKKNLPKTRPGRINLQAAVLPPCPRYYRATVVPPVLPLLLPRATEGFTVVAAVLVRYYRATVLPPWPRYYRATVVPCHGTTARSTAPYYRGLQKLLR